MDISKYRRGNPFDVPTHPDQLELMLGWIFDQVRVIVIIENHHHKFDSPDQVLEILHDSAEIEGVDVEFSYSDGQWNLERAGSKEDILNLPKVIKTFSRIYRHNALDYVESGL